MDSSEEGQSAKPKEATASVDPHCDVYTVKLLEEWLELARKGEIRNVVLVGRGPKGNIAWNWQGSWNLTEAVGAAYYAVQSLCADAREGAGDFDDTD